MPPLRFPGFKGAWKEQRLFDIGAIVTGSTPPTSDRSNYGIDYPFCSPSDVGGQRYISETERYVSDKGYRLGRPIPPGGIIVTCIGIIGKLGIASRAMITNQQINAVIVKPEFDVEFIFDAIGHIVPTLRTRASQQTLPILSKLEFGKVCIRIPPIPEQMKLGHFLSLLDSRIAAQRKLVELLKKHKRGLVQDLFTGELSKLPRRRFAGFKDAWISRSFDEVFSFLKNNTLPRSEMTTVGGMIRNVHYGDVLIKYGDVLECNRNQIPFLVGDKQLDDCRLLQDGDVVIADTAEDEAVGKAVELVGVANKLIESGLHTIACRPKIPFASRFLGYYLNSTAYRRQLLPLMQGIKVLSLSKSQLGKTQLLFPPDINEQKRIAELLAGTDAHSVMAQLHLDKMQSLKTGFLQQLFV